MLLNYKNYRPPRGWQVKTGGMHNMRVPILGAGMLILVGMVTVFPADGIFQSVIRILLSTAIFWLSLSVMVLLVMWGQKREQSTAEGAYHSDMNTLKNMVRSQRHDYNLHVQTVASLIAQQKWDECRGYVNAPVQDTSQMNDVLPVKDPFTTIVSWQSRADTHCLWTSGTICLRWSPAPMKPATCCRTPRMSCHIIGSRAAM